MRFVKMISSLLLVCVCVLFRKDVLYASNNPFWIDAKIEGDLARVTIGIKEVELNAFGLVLTYDQKVLKLEEAAEKGGYRYSESFWDSYCVKGTALSNAKENRLLFSGINADMKSSRFSGDIVIISFRILQGTLQSGSTTLNLNVNSLNISDQLLSLEESEKKISYHLSWNRSGYQTIPEPEKTSVVDKTTAPGTFEPQGTNTPFDSPAPTDFAPITEDSDQEDLDYIRDKDHSKKTENWNNIDGETDKEDFDIKAKKSNTKQIESLGITLETWILIAVALLCCIGIFIWRLIQKKRKK